MRHAFTLAVETAGKRSKFFVVPAGELAAVFFMQSCPYHQALVAAPADDEEICNFFRLAEAEGALSGPHPQRVAAAVAARAAGRAVALSEEELAFAARVAWRNEARCIGRLYWRSLRVRDCREVTNSAGMYSALCEHLELATREGDIRPVMTIFAPAESGHPGPLIRNRQLAGYAGYRERGEVLGDPLNCALTEEALALGWEPPKVRTAFDLLPWILIGRDELPALYSVPRNLVKEVALSHPTLPWFRELGLKWYAVPVVCDRVLRVAGTEYPAAPFSGWYMGTEIGSRNLADAGRYNLLPVVAKKMGLNVDIPASLWKERALVELNAAVLHSFAEARCRIVDHHTASEEFGRFCAQEKAAGRDVSAAWDWIVPPLAGAATPVFHQPMCDLHLRPEFKRGPQSD